MQSKMYDFWCESNFRESWKEVGGEPLGKWVHKSETVGTSLWKWSSETIFPTHLIGFHPEAVRETEVMKSKSQSHVIPAERGDFQWFQSWCQTYRKWTVLGLNESEYSLRCFRRMSGSPLRELPKAITEYFYKKILFHVILSAVFPLSV